MNSRRTIELLERLKGKEMVACLYRNPYSNKFSAGFVEGYTQNHVVLRSMSVYGCYDGWLLREVDALYRIDHGGRYEEKLLFLYQSKKQRHLADFLPTLGLEADLRYEMLLAAQKHDLAVSIDTGADTDICGFVRSVELDAVVIEKFTDYGQADGDSTIELEHIEGLSVDDEDMQDLKLLSRWHEMEPPAW